MTEPLTARGFHGQSGMPALAIWAMRMANRATAAGFNSPWGVNTVGFKGKSAGGIAVLLCACAQVVKDVRLGVGERLEKSTQGAWVRPAVSGDDLIQRVGV